MNLSKFPVYMQAAILALVLAVVGYLVAQALQFSLKAEVIFAAGLAIGGFVVPLFLKRTPANVAESIANQETCTLYVGNLPYRANEIAVRELFAEQGQVISARQYFTSSSDDSPHACKGAVSFWASPSSRVQ